MSTETQIPSVCPKTGKPIQVGHPAGWKRWLFPITGLAALMWFLVRVIPKPSRAAYPCQRVALPLASGFVVWLIGLFSSVVLFRKARQNWHLTRYKMAAMCLVVGLIVTAALPLGTLSGSAVAASHTDPANSPMGVAQGINPGRVTWVYDPSAAVWNGTTGNWWDEGNTNQAVVESMLSKSIQSLTSTTSDTAAWDALFRSFNQKHGKGNVGYTAGETIVIKLNNNEGRGSYAANNKINGSPQMVLALSRQLVNQAGVSQSAITFYDSSRYMIDDIYNKVKPEFPSIQFMDCCGQYGRLPPQFVANAIHYSRTNSNGSGLPRLVVDASYMINMAIMKLHGGQGITLIGKNHVGSISSISHQDFGPTSGYETFVDFMAHKDLGQNTFLFMIDSLYGHNSPDGVPNHRWNIAPFNGRWPSSLFVSQDQVAIDSVGYDFLSAEYPTYADLNNGDHYLHEAALANNPPSGVVYAPNGDGVQAGSLGVHEHWNNNTDRKYTRNLGTGNGIELVYIGPAIPPPTTPPPTTPPPPGSNLAIGRPVVCSSVENAGVPCEAAVDGNIGTRWGSLFSDPQWIYVDLGASYTINRVVLRWEAAYGRSYQIQVSDNASSWTTVYSTTTGDGGVDDLSVSGSGRYVRMYGTVRAIAYGYSLWEYEIYGGGTPPPTTPPPTTPPPTTPPPTTPPPTTPPATTPPATTPPATTPPPSGNLAQGKPITCSNAEAANPAANLVDGNTATRWAGTPWPQTCQLDLGASYSMNRTELMPYMNRAYQYRIEVSSDATTYIRVVDRSTNTTGGATLTDSFTSVSARYVRLVVTGASGYTGGWSSFYEFRIFGGGTPPPTTPPPTTPPATTPPPTTPPPTTPPPGTNLALGKPVTCSSVENAGTPCASAVDGNTGTRWSSAFSDPQSIYVDLGSVRTISRVVLRWEAAYGRAYQIQVSSDGASWTNIYTTTTGDGGMDDLTGLSGSGRYVRMLGTLRATAYGYSLWEFEVYGN